MDEESESLEGSTQSSDMSGLGFQRIPLAAGLPVGYSRAAGSSETR